MCELFEALHRRADIFGDRTALDDGATHLDYASLCGRVAGVAEELAAIAPSPPVIGLLAANSVEWIVGQLAGWYADKVVVPLPPFFPLPQLRHVVRDAGVTHVLCTSDMAGTALQLGVPVTPLSERRARFVPPRESAGAQIIYTSGSTGRPKGVRLAGRQMMWTAGALVQASGARAEDGYLSVLPLALLLETICAIMVPILAGAPVRIEPSLAAQFADGEAGALAELVADTRPSCMVLVPTLLAAWVAQLSDSGARAPDSLRFVAVGGAALSPAVAQRAWDLGIPVYEGYGLSECGSVVALNRPGERRPGTVGKPLPGLDVRIEDREIVVRGPSVMEGYLHGPPTQAVWRTGDVGEIDADGVLTVLGRIDNLLVTPLGRNISPEWIESLLVGDPRVAHCIVTYGDGPHLEAILVPTDQGESWFERASAAQIGTLIAASCRDAPAYAIPRRYSVVRAGELASLGFLTGSGRVRRRAMLDGYAGTLSFIDTASPPITPRSLANDLL